MYILFWKCLFWCQIPTIIWTSLLFTSKKTNSPCFTTVKNEIFCFFSSLSSRLDTKLLVSRQVLAPATPPAPTHHATVIVPAPAQPVLPHHVTVVTMGPASVINTPSTSRQNLDTIVQVRWRTSWSKNMAVDFLRWHCFFVYRTDDLREYFHYSEHFSQLHDNIRLI